MAQFTFGNFEFPDKHIERGKVNVKPNQRQTLDSYTDMTGLTHAFEVPHTKTEISFTTLPMSGEEMREIMRNMVANYLTYLKRDSYCRYFDDENGAFKTGHFYLDPSVEFPRDTADANGVPTKYKRMQWLFIEY